MCRLHFIQLATEGELRDVLENVSPFCTCQRFDSDAAVAAGRDLVLVDGVGVNREIERFCAADNHVVAAAAEKDIFRRAAEKEI